MRPVAKDRVGTFANETRNMPSIILQLWLTPFENKLLLATAGNHRQKIATPREKCA